MVHRPVRSSRSRTIARRGRRVPTIAIGALPKRHRLPAPWRTRRRTACRARSRSVRRSRSGRAVRRRMHEALTTARPLRRRRRLLWRRRRLLWRRLLWRRLQPLRRRLRQPLSPRSGVGRMRTTAPAPNHLDRPSKMRSPNAIHHAIGQRRRRGQPEQWARVRPARAGVVLTRRARRTSSPDALQRAPAWPGAPPIAWPVARWRRPVGRASLWELALGLRRGRACHQASARARRVRSSVRSRRPLSVARQGSWCVA